MVFTNTGKKLMDFYFTDTKMGLQFNKHDKIVKLAQPIRFTVYYQSFYVKVNSYLILGNPRRRENFSLALGLRSI